MSDNKHNILQFNECIEEINESVNVADSTVSNLITPIDVVDNKAEEKYKINVVDNVVDNVADNVVDNVADVADVADEVWVYL